LLGGGKGDVGMPLSEDEQRILHQIERQFYESDPAFAQSVSQSSLYHHAFRNIKWGLAGVVAGLAFLLATLRISVLLSFVGFLGMLAAAFVIERNARKLGRAGWEQVSGTMRTVRLRSASGAAKGRLRRRLKRDEPEA
jgi:uncharacterized membrane protein